MIKQGRFHSAFRKRIPHGSRDVSHVPKPDPAALWSFAEGQLRVIAVQPHLTFRVTKIHDTWIEGTQELDDITVHGTIDLDYPVVITRSPEGIPQVTLTLRKINNGKAFIQVTVNPNLLISAIPMPWN